MGGERQAIYGACTHGGRSMEGIMHGGWGRVGYPWDFTLFSVALAKVACR